MGRRGFACGALTGGVLAISMATGLQRESSREDVRGLREATYSRVQQFTRIFDERFGSVECRALTGCDFLTPEGQARFKELGLMDGVCRPAVALAVETVAALCD